MNTRTGYYVQCIDECTRFEIGEILQVTSVSAQPDGTVLLGFDDNICMWRDEHFTEVVICSESSDVVVYERPEETLELTRAEYNQLLKDSQWWAAALNCKIGNWCDFPDLVEEYNRLEKEE